MLAIIFAAVLCVSAWGVLIAGPARLLGRFIARAFVRFINGKD